MSAMFPGAFLLLAIILGGGARLGVAGDILMQILAIPLGLAACWIILDRRQSDPTAFRLMLGFTGCALVFAMSQIALAAMHSPAAAQLRFGADSEGLVIVDQVLKSARHLGPHAAMAGLAGLLPTLAVFLAVLTVKPERRLALAGVVIAMGAVSLALGFAQILEGPQSALRFHPSTNRQEAVGFFANRNHFAALLYVTLLFAAVLFVRIARQMHLPGAAASRTFIWLTISALALIAVVAGLAVSRSRAGIILAIAALGLIFLMSLMDRVPTPERDRRTRPKGKNRIVLATLAFAALFAAQFGLGGLIRRLQNDAVDGLRQQFTATTFELSWQTLPFGTGLGSFLPVYATAEKTSDVFIGIANNAHNDLAEVLLETGLVGLALIACFLIWFLARAARVWFRPTVALAPDQLLLQRAATAALSLLLLHSLVDYPLRTMALGCIAAFASALLADPVESMQPEATAAVVPAQVDKRPPPAAVPVTPASPPELDAAWMEKWRQEQDQADRRG
jgi:O-antigen ligase